MSTIPTNSRTVADGPNAAPIVPRWEWRTFSADVPASAAHLHSAATGEPVTSQETYLLSLDSPNNVKIRNGVLDSKALLRSSADGLELWWPVIKAPFPVDRDAIVAVFRAWGIPLRAPRRERYSISQLLDELIHPEARLRAVDVSKRRTRLTVEECPGEVVELDVAGQRWHGLGFEHEDPRVVLTALHSLRLDSHANTNYPRALKRMLGWSVEAHV